MAILHGKQGFLCDKNMYSGRRKLSPDQQRSMEETKKINQPIPTLGQT